MTSPPVAVISRVACPVLPDTIPERVSFTVPAAPLGDYWMYAHNGHADKWGWSERLSCTIVGAQDHVQTHEWPTASTLTNTGGDTAESVQIIAELRVNGEVVESGEQQIDFLSRGETEEGAFIFSRNPSQGQLIVRSSSYKLP